MGAHDTALLGLAVEPGARYSALLMLAPTRCLAVDDHPTVREGLGLMFGDTDDLRLVGQVHSGEEVVEAINRLRPEVVIMDVRLPGIDGISAVKRIAEAAPR